MDIQQAQLAVKTCLRKYVDFTGRAARPEFWWFFLAQVIVFLVTSMVSELLYFVAAAGLLLPGLAVGARRLHDIGKSGWWMLIGLIPVLGWVLLIYWAVQPGEPAANAYGGPSAGADPVLATPG